MRIPEVRRQLAGVDPVLPVYKSYGGAEIACTTAHTEDDQGYRLLHEEPTPAPMSVATLLASMPRTVGPFLAFGPDEPEPLWRLIALAIRPEAVVLYLAPPDGEEDPDAQTEA
jgi:hypothetical protein